MSAFIVFKSKKINGLTMPGNKKAALQLIDGMRP